MPSGEEMWREVVRKERERGEEGERGGEEGEGEGEGVVASDKGRKQECWVVVAAQQGRLLLVFTLLLPVGDSSPMFVNKYH